MNKHTLCILFVGKHLLIVADTILSDATLWSSSSSVVVLSGLIQCIRALSDLRNAVWHAVAEARDAFGQGYPLVISKHGDLQYASRCWSETAAGEEIEVESTVRSHGTGGSPASEEPSHTRSAVTKPASGGSNWMRSFWRMGATASTGRSYQLYSIHLASLPAAAIADTMKRLAAECREHVQCARETI